MCGGRHWSVVHIHVFPLQKQTVGRRVRRKDGNRSGHCCLKWWPHVLNYLNVDARRGVGYYANVSGLLSNVHHSVTAVVTATTMIAIIATRTSCAIIHICILHIVTNVFKIRMVAIYDFGQYVIFYAFYQLNNETIVFLCLKTY